jgi:putative transposase
MISNATQLSTTLGVSRACEVMGVPRSSFYRAQQSQAEPKTRPTSSRALTPTERAHVRQVLNSERFVDQSPRQVYATLLDEGLYLCHWRTMYHILQEHQEVNERRNQRQHPPAPTPHLEATGPNQLWSWDITKLNGPAKRHLFYLYVILDVYSRFVVGWLLAEAESAELAEQLISTTCRRQGIEPEQLGLHSDRGPAMQAKTIAQLLADLEVAQTFARPYTPNDNAYSEAQFKTFKYRPAFPDRFGSLAEARTWVQTFMRWYNYEHYHSALALLTPATVHHGLARPVLAQRQQVLATAYQTHPERFVGGPPTVAQLPTSVWLNKPSLEVEITCHNP